jgi:glycopeptide antibiotics resistance protein
LSHFLHQTLTDPPRWLRLLCVMLFVALIGNLFFHGSKPYAVGLLAHPWDKLVHALLFAILAWLACLTLPQWPSWAVFVVVATVALADELHQLNLPGRSADIKDILADVSGAGVALIVIKVVGRRGG